MSNFVYLWNTYRTRRHVADSDSGAAGPLRLKALCGEWHENREQTECTLRRWNVGVRLQRYLDALDTVPICKKCAKKAGIVVTEKPKSGVDLIAAERKRQVEVEGWTAEHDAEHRHFELTRAALCYAEAAWSQEMGLNPQMGEWPWDRSSWRPSDDPIHNLAKAGALIAAEIDRLQHPPTRRKE